MLPHILTLMIGFATAFDGLVFNQPYQIVDRYCTEGVREPQDKKLSNLRELAIVFKAGGKMDMVRWATGEKLVQTRYQKVGDNLTIINAQSGQPVRVDLRYEGEIVTLTSDLPKKNPERVCLGKEGAVVMVLKPVSVK